jgi:hypothetical protein
MKLINILKSCVFLLMIICNIAVYGQYDNLNHCVNLSWTRDETIPISSGLYKYHYVLKVINTCNETIKVAVTHPGVDGPEYPDGTITHSWTIKPNQEKTNHCKTSSQVSYGSIKYTVKKCDDGKYGTTCTLIASIRLPLDLASGGMACSETGGIRCVEIAKILANPIEYWNGNVDDCKVGIEKLKKGKYVDATITITGLKSTVQRLYGMIVPSAH